MSKRTRTTMSTAVITSILTACCLALAGCSSSSSAAPSGSNPGTGSSTAATTARLDPTVAAQVPSAIKAKGKILVASDATYPPLEFIGSDGTTVVGADADLAVAIGQVLGIPVTVSNASFDTIIPALQAGKFDMGMSGFNDTKARQAVVDFVDYYKGGSSFFVLTAGGPTINSLSDLCGHKVAVEKGTTQQDDITTQNQACLKAGKPAITALIYPDQNATNLALSSGRADVSIADTPVAQYQVKQSNNMFKISGSEYGVVLHGIALPKGNGMAPVVRDAVQDLITQGVYKQIMDKWGIGDSSITAVTIDGATS